MIFNNEILPIGYNIFRKDRSSRGGGVMVAVRDFIPTREILIPTILEAVSIEILTQPSFYFCCISVPPDSNCDYFKTLFSYIRSLPIMTHNVIIYGDFNFPDINWFTLTSSSGVSAQFCDLLTDLNLSQLIFTHTHIKGNILDLLITNNPNCIDNVIVHEHNMLPFHLLVTFCTKPSIKFQSHYNSTEPIYFFTACDLEQIVMLMGNYNFDICYNSDDIDFISETQ